MKKNISIREIAEICNVSVATVSRVLNNNGRFSIETRDRVLKTVRETGYEVNTVAKSLRSKKSETVGILVPDISNSFFANIVEQIEYIMFEHGYSTIICNTARSKTKESAYTKMLESKMVDGIIVISGFNEFDTSKIRKDIPVICIDRKTNKLSSQVLIESDHYMGGRLATELLIEKKCKNIAIVTYKESLSSSRERLQGYSDVLREASRGLESNQIVKLEKSDKNIRESRVEQSKKTVKQFLKLNPTIDGIFAINDKIAIGAIQAVESLRKVPGCDVQIIGFDNDLVSRYCSPTLTTISQDTITIARKACTTLLSLMADINVEVEQHQVIPVSVIERNTTKKD